ncbi:MAG: phospho-sugar mutase [Patescibacteria group bacterium]|nr:phospho-sugar mutase [Patescibacteria group bacterium]
MNTEELLQQTKQGFSQLKLGEEYKEKALINLKRWLIDPQCADYRPQVVHLIEAQHWDYLLDSFYQVMPFGTGGKRGEVGVGPNRINEWNIRASAQGHAQYLLRKYQDKTKTRGVVLTYDVREFLGNKYFDKNIPNPAMNLTCKDLAWAAAEVYAANGIKIYTFDSFRSTPELSFAIRHLNAVAGDMFSASHNPPDHNGMKVFDEFGGQLIPPQDEELVSEVTENVEEIKNIPFTEAQEKGLIEIVGEKVDQAYWRTCKQLSLSANRDLKIVYTPLHGCGSTSVFPVLKKLGFNISMDPKTEYPNGKFENVTFNIPNPEVEQSFDTTLKYAQEVNADLILNSDPDADRIGIMVKHQDNWRFINGQEIAAILTDYAIKKMKPDFKGEGTVIKTQVTTNLLQKICDHYQINLIGDLLVGFKYIGKVMNTLEEEGELDEFIVSCEESHGYLAGSYARDKDAVVGAIWLSELAAKLKTEGKTLLDYLNKVYAQFGYFRNYLTEIRLPGAEGRGKILSILDQLREKPPEKFGNFTVEKMEDWRDRKPFVSQTDIDAKNSLVFYFKPIKDTSTIRVTVRPSGTEPKVKMYFEIGSVPFKLEDIIKVKADIEKILKKLEKDFMKVCYQLIDIDFPDRGFLLFWQLPIQDKLHYFKIEEQIADLKNTKKEKRADALAELLEFLGSDPIDKVDLAFKKKYGQSMRDYLEIK